MVTWNGSDPSRTGAPTDDRVGRPPPSRSHLILRINTRSVLTVIQQYISTSFPYIKMRPNSSSVQCKARQIAMDVLKTQTHIPALEKFQALDTPPSTPSAPPSRLWSTVPESTSPSRASTAPGADQSESGAVCGGVESEWGWGDVEMDERLTTGSFFRCCPRHRLRFGYGHGRRRDTTGKTTPERIHARTAGVSFLHPRYLRIVTRPPPLRSSRPPPLLSSDPATRTTRQRHKTRKGKKKKFEAENFVQDDGPKSGGKVGGRGRGRKGVKRRRVEDEEDKDEEEAAAALDSTTQTADTPTFPQPHLITGATLHPYARGAAVDAGLGRTGDWWDFGILGEGIVGGREERCTCVREGEHVAHRAGAGRPSFAYFCAPWIYFGTFAYFAYFALCAYFPFLLPSRTFVLGLLSRTFRTFLRTSAYFAYSALFVHGRPSLLEADVRGAVLVRWNRRRRAYDTVCWTCVWTPHPRCFISFILGPLARCPLAGAPVGVLPLRQSASVGARMVRGGEGAILLPLYAFHSFWFLSRAGVGRRAARADCLARIPADFPSSGGRAGGAVWYMTYNYYYTYRSDGIVLKAVVGDLWFVDALHIGLCTYTIWYYVVEAFYTAWIAQIMNWSFKLSIWLSVALILLLDLTFWIFKILGVRMFVVMPLHVRPPNFLLRIIFTSFTNIYDISRSALITLSSVGTVFSGFSLGLEYLDRPLLRQGNYDRGGHRKQHPHPPCNQACLRECCDRFRLFIRDSRLCCRHQASEIYDPSMVAMQSSEVEHGHGHGYNSTKSRQIEGIMTRSRVERAPHGGVRVEPGTSGVKKMKARDFALKIHVDGLGDPVRAGQLEKKSKVVTSPKKERDDDEL
ncbi:hypothetical protein B0H16DRAFT_1697375 [Mycena metata]|uniref:Uncharacterized protein n=1 Tax=Mycena metata TaxID=1033252 RepID=A0AAD7HUL6_9AGAR|nr:hypothetical protein B0H16DRAFT_1697375 [Mycena metata]